MTRQDAREESDAVHDWREEFECAECRAWTGKPPVPIYGVEEEVREELGPIEFKLSHACYLCVDADGNHYHVPTTVLEWPGGRHQWIPELPPGHRPEGRSQK
jgi:hypothetical protein